MREQGNLKILVGALLVGVAGVSVAYSVLNQTLNTTYSKITSTTLSWKVGFDTTSTEVAATVAGTSDTGRSCGKATLSESAVSIAETSLSKPGDKCTWALTIKNAGTIDALLDTVTGTNPNSVSCTNQTGQMVCGNITYKLATNAEGTTLITEKSQLAKSSTLAVYLIAEYTGNDVVATQITHTGTKFTLNYVQK